MPPKPAAIEAAVKKAVQKRKESKADSDTKLYLFIYNLAQTIGWSIILVRTVLHFALGGSIDTLWYEIGQTLKIFQSLAILEILHPILGLVRADVVSTFIQVASRLFVLWGDLVFVPETRLSPWFVSCVISWAITEIFRYAYYTAGIYGTAPRWLKVIRYETSLGIASEIGLSWAALPVVQATQTLSVSMPNALNFSFNYYYFIWGCLAAYIPGAPFMYTHMLSQRKKQINRKDA